MDDDILDLECDLKRFAETGITLGEGGFGRVFLVKDKKTNDQYAVKQYLQQKKGKKTTSQFDLEDMFFKEVEAMIGLKHPFIIQLVGFQIPDKACGREASIIMEYAKGGSLGDIIENGEDLPKPELVFWEIARAMKYMHSKGKIHRDLKPENILFDKPISENQNAHVKIADFGLARDESSTMTMGQGTCQYLAPELACDGKGHYSNKVDVFSFGQIMMEYFSGEPLYPEGYNNLNIFHLLNKGQIPECPDTVEPKYRNIIEQCRKIDPDERPSFDEIEVYFRQLVGEKQTRKSIIWEYECLRQEDLIQKAVDLEFQRDAMMVQLLNNGIDLPGNKLKISRDPDYIPEFEQNPPVVRKSTKRREHRSTRQKKYSSSVDNKSSSNPQVDEKRSSGRNLSGSSNSSQHLSGSGLTSSEHSLRPTYSNQMISPVPSYPMPTGNTSPFPPPNPLQQPGFIPPQAIAPTRSAFDSQMVIAMNSGRLIDAMEFVRKGANVETRGDKVFFIFIINGVFYLFLLDKILCFILLQRAMISLKL